VCGVTEQPRTAALGPNVRRRRNRRGLMAKDLAAQAGLSVSYVCDIENGRANPSLPVLVKLAELLGCSIDDLLRG